MSQHKGGASGRGRRPGQGPTRLCYTPHPIRKSVIGTESHRASLGDSRLSVHICKGSEEAESFPAEPRLHTQGSREPSLCGGPSHSTQHAPLLSAFQARPAQSVQSKGVVSDKLKSRRLGVKGTENWAAGFDESVSSHVAARLTG